VIRRLLPAIALLVLCLVAAPRPVSAYDFFKGGCNSDTANAVACQSQPATDSNGNSIDPLVGPDGLLAHITNIVTIVAGAAAVILIIVSALKLITSGSDVSTGSRTDTDIEDARRALANAVIGLVVIVAARTIIVYLLNRL
jgi:hypothetical protein